MWHWIRNLSPSGLRSSTLPLRHGGSPQYSIFPSAWVAWIGLPQRGRTHKHRHDRHSAKPPHYPAKTRRSSNVSTMLGQRRRRWANFMQQTWDIHPMLVQCWASVVYAGPALCQHWMNVPCLLGTTAALESLCEQQYPNHFEHKSIWQDTWNSFAYLHSGLPFIVLRQYVMNTLCFLHEWFVPVHPRVFVAMIMHLPPQGSSAPCGGRWDNDTITIVWQLTGTTVLL